MGLHAAKTGGFAAYKNIIPRNGKKIHSGMRLKNQNPVFVTKGVDFCTNGVKMNGIVMLMLYTSV